MDDPGRAAAASLAAGAVERFAGPERLAGALVGKATPTRAPGVSRAQSAGQEALRSALAEAPTEVMQSGIERAGAFQDLGSEEALGDYAFSALAGSIGGAGIGGPLGALKPEGQPAPDAPPDDQEGLPGAGLGGPNPEPPPAEPAPGQASPQFPEPGPPGRPNVRPPRGPNAQLDNEGFEGYTFQGNAGRERKSRKGSFTYREGGQPALPPPQAAPNGEFIVGPDGTTAPQTMAQADASAAAREERRQNLGLTPDVIAAQSRREQAARDLEAQAQMPDAGPLTKAVGRNVQNTSLGAQAGIAPPETGPDALESPLRGQQQAGPDPFAEDQEANYQRALQYPVDPERGANMQQLLLERGVEADVLPHPNQQGKVMVVPRRLREDIQPEAQVEEPQRTDAGERPAQGQLQVVETIKGQPYKSEKMVRARIRQLKLNPDDYEVRAEPDGGYRALLRGPEDTGQEQADAQQTDAPLALEAPVAQDRQEDAQPAGPDRAPSAEVAEPERADDTSNEAPELVEHVTKKGKRLRGVVRTDMSRDQAKAVDPYTFKKNGGYFIREQHLSALNGDTPAPKDDASNDEPRDRKRLTNAINRVTRNDRKAADLSDTYENDTGRTQVTLYRSPDVDDPEIEVTTSQKVRGGKVKVDRERGNRVRYSSVRDQLSPEARSEVEAFIARNKAEAEPGATPPQAQQQAERPQAAPSQAREIGQNQDGQTIFEDANGVRFYTEDGATVREPARVAPNGETTPRSRERRADTRFEAASEARSRRRQEGTYTLTDARNDLIDLRTQAEQQGRVGDARLQERVRQQEQLVRDMERQQGGNDPDRPRGPRVIVNEVGPDGLTDQERAQQRPERTPTQQNDLMGESSPESVASLTALRDSPDAARVDGMLKNGQDRQGNRMPDWRDAGNGFSAREYVWDGRPVQEVRAPNGAIATRSMDSSGRPYAELEASATLDEFMSGAPFRDFERFFQGREQAPAGERPQVESDGTAGAEQPAGNTEPQPSANTVFTEEAAARARERIRAKLNRVSSGVDPELLQDGIILAGYHIERGARTFSAYARAMVADMGEAVKPYLKSWYMGVKYDPRAEGWDGLSSPADVDSADVDAILQEAGDATRSVDSPGAEALEGAPAEGVQADAERPDAGEGTADSGPADIGRDADAGGSGVQADRTRGRWSANGICSHRRKRATVRRARTAAGTGRWRPTSSR